MAADECACSRLCHDTAVSPTAAQRSAKLVKQRVDELLVERGLADTRSKAQALVMAGKVRIGEGDGARRDVKPGDRIPTDTRISIDEPEPYVGRGGYKLAAALDAFGIDPAHKVALDVGASTGGFTDVLLQRGATRVYALDVGRGQLAESLRTNPRVVSMERTNARELTATTLPEPIDLAVIDVSFISLEKVLPAVFGVLAPRSEIVALVKPQFEVGRQHVGKGGVVREPAQHRAVVQRLARYAVLRGWHALSVTASPLRGPKGNREFYLHLSAQGRTEIGRASCRERVSIRV